MSVDMSLRCSSMWSRSSRRRQLTGLPASWKSAENRAVFHTTQRAAWLSYSPVRRNSEVVEPGPSALPRGTGVASLVHSLQLADSAAAKSAVVASFFSNASNLHDLDKCYSYDDVMKLLVALTEAEFKFSYQSEFTKRTLLRIAAVSSDVPGELLPSFLHTVTTLLNLSVTPEATQRVLQGRVREVVSLVEELSEEADASNGLVNQTIKTTARSRVALRDFYLRNVHGRSYHSMRLACRQEDRDRHDWENTRIKYNDIVPQAVAEELDRLEERYPDQRTTFDDADSDDEDTHSRRLKQELQLLRMANRNFNSYEDPEAQQEDEAAYQIYKRGYRSLDKQMGEVAEAQAELTGQVLRDVEANHPDANVDKSLFSQLHELDQRGVVEEQFFSVVEGAAASDELSPEQWSAIENEVSKLRAKGADNLTEEDRQRIAALQEQFEAVAARHHAGGKQAEAEAEEEEEQQLSPLEVGAAMVEALKARAAGIEANMLLEPVSKQPATGSYKAEEAAWMHHVSEGNSTVPFRRPPGSADFVDRYGGDSFSVREIKHQFGRVEDEEALVARLMEGYDERRFVDPREDDDAYYTTDADDDDDQHVNEELGLFLHVVEQAVMRRPVAASSDTALAELSARLEASGSLADAATHEVYDAVVALLGQRVTAEREHLSPSQLLTALQAFVLLVYPDAEATTDLVRRLVAAGDQLSYAQTADLLAAVATVPFLRTPGDWAFGSLEGWSATLTSLSARLSDANALASAQPAAIALATFAFGQLRFRPAERKLVALCDAMLAASSSFDGNSAALFLAGLTALKFAPSPVLLDALLEAAVKDVERLSFSDVTAVVAALANCHYEPMLAPTDFVTPLIARAGRAFSPAHQGSELLEEFAAACRKLDVMPTVNLELPYWQATYVNQSDIERTYMSQRHLKNLIWERRLATNEDYVQRLQDYSAASASASQ